MSLYVEGRMDLDIYVEAIMLKLEDAKYYSELSEDELKQSIDKYLTNEYNDRIALLQLEVDLENARGTIKDADFYRSKLTSIKSYIISLTRELSKSTKD